MKIIGLLGDKRPGELHPYQILFFHLLQNILCPLFSKGQQQQQQQQYVLLGVHDFVFLEFTMVFCLPYICGLSSVFLEFAIVFCLPYVRDLSSVFLEFAMVFHLPYTFLLQAS